MTATLSPEAFMAQPSEPDEDVLEQLDTLTDPLASMAESLRQLVEHFERNTVTAQESTDWISEGLSDLEEKHATVVMLVEEIEAIIKPSVSKLANEVREAITRWRAPEVPAEPVGGEPDNDAPPAHDADVEEWRAWARGRGLEGADTLNRSQIRTALGIEQPS